MFIFYLKSIKYQIFKFTIYEERLSKSNKIYILKNYCN